MIFQIHYSTDVGIKKSVNQDSLCIKKAKTRSGNIVMAILCDGMGGLDCGEVASATVVRAFAKWFEQELPRKLQDISIEKIREDWTLLVNQQNKELYLYGKKNEIQLGTTITGILVLADGEYFIIHVGDSRAYKISQNRIDQLTEDQSLVAREVKKGNITRAQAETDPRRNILLQCIGVSTTVEAECQRGKVLFGDILLICSDGFRHKLQEEEILEKIHDADLKTEKEIHQILELLIKENKNRGEADNISAILIKAD